MDIVAQTNVSWGEDGMKRHALYAYYYAALALIQGAGYHGERYWREWNRDFQKAVLDSQSEDGHWEFPQNAHTKHGLVYSTAMCTLMLEVYYRYLPMYQLMRTPTRSDAQPHLTPPSPAPRGVSAPQTG